MITSQTETFVVEDDFTAVDHLIYRRYRRPTPGLLEATLELNPGLTTFGPFIPRGTEVVVPIFVAPAADSISVIRLWN